MSPQAISLVTSWHAAIGITGSRHHLCKADFDLDETMRVGAGGGVECAPSAGSRAPQIQHYVLKLKHTTAAWRNLAACRDEAVEVLALPLKEPERTGFFHDNACPKSGGMCFALQWMTTAQA